MIHVRNWALANFLWMSIIGAGHLLGQTAEDLIQSGPMLGHISMRSAQIWVQTSAQSKVQIEYSPQGEVEYAWLRTPPVKSNERSGHTAQLELIDLEPGTAYDARVVVDDQIASEVFDFSTQVLWDYRMDPPPFKFVTGSCAYINEEAYDRPGKPYGGGYEIFESMANEAPDMMLWLGDNIYLREVDFQSYSGFVHRYSHMRSTPEMARLLKA